MLTPRVFLLSPAHLGGERARILLRDEARFDLATRVKRPEGVPVGEIFAFLSGLYFRGKLTYAATFARAPKPDVAPAYVITSNRGLTTVHERYNQRDLEALGTTDIDARNDAYRKPLARDAKKLAKKIGRDTDVVLLGSVASTKYIEVLEEIFAERLVFPIDFVGRGDMSRGALMLRAARAGVELPYVAVCDVLGAKLLACRARSS
ncbi:MAG TPA: hypothetical protein VHB97_11575 [Polyangia bacterium]|nr:hypothetical protein [Polyangia bacterium]